MGKGEGREVNVVSLGYVGTKSMIVGTKTYGSGNKKIIKTLVCFKRTNISE
jgi:hypothetical protein